MTWEINVMTFLILEIKGTQKITNKVGQYYRFNDGNNLKQV